MAIKLKWYKKGDIGGASEQDVMLESPGIYTIGRGRECDIVLSDSEASRLHAKLELKDDKVFIIDAESTNGTFLSDERVMEKMWPSNAQLRIGDHIFVLEQEGGLDYSADVDGDPVTKIRVERPAKDDTFPGGFFEQPVVSVKSLKRSGQLAGEIDYCALGGGFGSFVWVDHLRVFGVAADKVKAIGVDPVPYAKYKRLCEFSQIPLHERLRSNSLSTPDNIWGFPGYASRESFAELKAGKLSGLKYIMQVFGEPSLIESYTPRAGDVYKAMDREAKRIGWDQIWTAGRILKIRKTDDGRYAVAYRIPADHSRGENRNKYYITKHLHLATGYPASRYLPDLQEFKRQHPQSRRVINAYEEHSAIYEDLEKNGGTVLIRGRGIVASRILQKLYETRAKNPQIRVLHVMRSRITEGSVYDLARRHAAHDIEYQPFNWPKACWGGTLREKLESASEDGRAELLGQWGGTTTADRADWDAIITDGKREGWSRPFFGKVKSLILENEKIITQLESSLDFKEETNLEADYVVDCTGLIAGLEENPLLRDLIETYSLARNKVSGNSAEARFSGLKVTNSFEIEGLRNGEGRAYAAGVLTTNGPYAVVDSFLGLQYAALRSVDSLQKYKAPNISGFHMWRSFSQWLKWCRNEAP